MDRTDYWNKVSNILDDPTRFFSLDADPVKTTFKRENEVRTFPLDLKKANVMTEEVYKQLSPTGSRPGILYGWPKVHRFGTSLRPILSSTGIHSFNISKFLVPLLLPISISPFSIGDTFSFIQDLFRLDFNTGNVVMASFDITSLFTNIPIDETIEIIVSQLFAAKSH